VAKETSTRERIERAQRKLAKAQAAFQAAQQKRALVIAQGEQEIERVRRRAALRLRRATERVERRAGAMARAQARLLALNGGAAARSEVSALPPIDREVSGAPAAAPGWLQEQSPSGAGADEPPSGGEDERPG